MITGKLRKGLLAIVVGLCILFNINAQLVMPKDEQGKIVYLDVVKMDSISQDTLFKRATQWVKFTYPIAKKTIDTIEKRIVTRGRFLVYTKPGVLKEIHGAIRYDLVVEIKDNKYRYTFTNFVFEYYKQNRNYEYKPTGQEKPLEEEKFPGWQGPWDKHKYTTEEHVKAKAVDLLKSVENKKPETKIIPVIKKEKDW